MGAEPIRSPQTVNMVGIFMAVSKEISLEEVYQLSNVRFPIPSWQVKTR